MCLYIYLYTVLQIKTKQIQMQTDVNCKLEDNETGKKQRVFSLFEREPALRNSRRKMRGLKKA